MAKITILSSATLREIQKLMNDTWDVKFYAEEGTQRANARQNFDYDLTLSQHWSKRNKQIFDIGPDILKPKPPKIRNVIVDDDTTIGKIWQEYSSMGFTVLICDKDDKRIVSNIKLKDVYKEEVNIKKDVNIAIKNESKKKPKKQKVEKVFIPTPFVSKIYNEKKFQTVPYSKSSQRTKDFLADSKPIFIISILLGIGVSVGSPLLIGPWETFVKFLFSGLSTFILFFIIGFFIWANSRGSVYKKKYDISQDKLKSEHEKAEADRKSEHEKAEADKKARYEKNNQGKTSIIPKSEWPKI